jgi:hypothetical protein
MVAVGNPLRESKQLLGYVVVINCTQFSLNCFVFYIKTISEWTVVTLISSIGNKNDRIVQVWTHNNKSVRSGTQDEYVLHADWSRTNWYIYIKWLR